MKDLPKEYQLIDIPTDSTAYIFDIEADGFFEEMTKIHCVWSLEANSKEWLNSANCNLNYKYGDCDERLQIHLGLLQEADYLIGHNIIGYDIPAIQKIYPWFKPKGIIIDTLIWSNLCYPNMFNVDPIKKQFIAPLKRKLLRTNKDTEKELHRELSEELKYYNKLYGKHSLKAWGYRLGELKGDFSDEDTDWSIWTPEMHEYCKQDVWVNYKVYQKLLERKEWVTNKSLWVEHEVKKIITRQEARGAYFDTKKAQEFYCDLVEVRERLRAELTEAFGDVIKKEYFTPKRDNKTKGYVKGKTIVRTNCVPFNPASSDHIVHWFKEKYQWKPIEFNKNNGKPKMDESVLKDMPYPEAELLAEFKEVNKLIGMLGDGDKAWLKLVTSENRIHGSVNTQGTATGRMSHSNPNLGQIPARGTYGHTCRELFVAPKGMKLVGCDASALEIRCLAHYINDEQYTDIVLNGDIHTENQKSAGLPTRDNAKTFFYGWLYGAGNAKIGSIVGKGSKEGGRLKKKFLEGLPALRGLMNRLQNTLRNRNYLKGIDGRRVPTRSPHSALNFLLQGLGAMVMKYAQVIADYRLQAEGLIPNKDYAFVLTVHDEFDLEVKETLTDTVGEILRSSIIDAGEYLELNCPMDAEAKVGICWAEVH